MPAETDTTGNPIDPDKDLGEGAEDLRDEPEGQPKTERQVDKGLKETFPASDAMPANPGAD